MSEPTSFERSGAAPGEPRAAQAEASPAEVQSGFNSRGKVRQTRAGVWWIGLTLAAALGIVLAVFIIQNAESVPVEFFGFDGRLPLAVALFLAGIAGMLVVALPSAIRILQLRRALVKNAAGVQHPPTG